MDATYDLTLKAEIVGVMEGADEPSMKVLVKPLYLTIPADLRVHLGDTVLINAELSIRAIQPDVESGENSASVRR
jgi:hypothetical protein